jgi:Holliday junction resolvase RusA-like endonuclease
MAVTEWTLRIPGWVPVSVNKLAGQAHWAKKRDSKDKDKRVLLNSAMLAGMTDHPPAGRRRVQVHVVYPKGAQRFDRDNLRKSLFDGMVRAGLLRNDSPVWLEDAGLTDSRDDQARAAVTYITITDL